jgi:L-serine dehydratase
LLIYLAAYHLILAKDQNIEVNIIEEEGDSIGEHPNCAYLVAEGNGRHIEVIGLLH